MAKPALSYLLKSPRSHNFYFRIRVPCSLRGVVIREEFRYSLRTSDELEARYLAAKIAERIKSTFRLIHQWSLMRELTNEEIEAFVYRHIREVIAHQEESRAGLIAMEDLESYLGLIKGNIIDFQAELSKGDYHNYSGAVEEMLEEHGIDWLKGEDYSFKRLCRELLKGRIRALNVELKRATGDYSDNIEEEISSKLDAIAPPKISIEDVNKQVCHQQTDLGPTIPKLIQMYADERKKAGAWTQKTEQEYLTSLGLLSEILGDIPVSTIDVALARKFKETVMSLPPNIRKDGRYRDKSIEEIVAMKVKTTMNPSTVNKTINRNSSMLNWAVRNGYMEKNPLLGMHIQSKKRADEFRDVFSTEDLKKLFQSKAYVEDTHLHSFYFWIPIIALFTGMRLDEICQLHLDDIRKEDGVYVFDVNDDGERKLKNLSSKRIVPIHDFLVDDLKIIQYVETLRKSGEIRLFPELKKRRDGYGQEVSKWFARYRKRCGIVPERGKKDFHSFRHTLADNLKQAIVETSLLMELLGHSGGSITLDRYGKRYNAKLLKDKVVDQLNFGVDLEHLKGSRFVVGLS